MKSAISLGFILYIGSIGNVWADPVYTKADFGFNGCKVSFGPLQENVAEETMGKISAATNAKGFAYNPVYNYGYVMIGEYPENCKSPASESLLLYLKVAAPNVVQISSKEAPTPPVGMKITCMTGPNSPRPDWMSSTCPVISYNGVDFWPYSYIDNRVSIGLVGYKSGQIVQSLELPGTRYAWNATVDNSTKSVSIWGQVQGSSVSTSWESLNETVLTDPVVTQINTTYAPTPPDGMKITCMTGPDSPISPTCPVISYNGVDFWPYSYIDNRVSIGLVGYKSGKIVQKQELQGTRYAWDVTLDTHAKTVSIFGQSGSSVSTSWDSLK